VGSPAGEIGVAMSAVAEGSPSALVWLFLPFWLGIV